VTRDLGSILRTKLPGVNWAAPSMLAIFLFLGLASFPWLSLTTDEPIHYRYGMRILNSDAGRFDDSVMPVSALNALPAWIGEHLPDSMLSRGLRHYQVGRLPTLLVAILLAYAVYAWSRKLYGSAGGLLSLFLYSFDPNLLAHSRLMTQDLFLAASVVLSFYFVWRFARRRSVARAMAAAVFVGLAQVTKYTAVVLPLFVVAMLLVYDGRRLFWLARRGGWGRLARYGGRSFSFALLFLGVSLLIINVAFLREYTLRPLRDYRFRSPFFQGVQAWAGAAGEVPVPVPEPYLKGLDAVLSKERSGHGHGRIYLLGELREERGFAGYFMIAYALKTPLAMQGIFVLVMAGLLKKWRWSRVMRHEQFLLVPIVVYGLYFNFLFRAQIGLRFLLMMFPLMHVLSGRLLQGFAGWNNRRRAALAVGAVWIAVSTLSFFPDYLAYFNEIVWDRRLAYRYLADSNLDWGQSDVYLREYLARHPEAMLEPEEITEGEVIVRVNNLVGITEDPDRYALLREECTPVAAIGHAYLLFRVPCGEEAGTDPP